MPILTEKLTISREKAQEVFYQKTSFFSRKNVYHECYDILGQNPSFRTYNCRIIAEYLYQATQHLHSARKYHKVEHEKALCDIEIINKDIQTILDVQNKMEKYKKDNSELKNNKDFIDIAADLRTQKRYLEDEKKH